MRKIPRRPPSASVKVVHVPQGRDNAWTAAEVATELTDPEYCLHPGGGDG